MMTHDDACGMVHGVFNVIVRWPHSTCAVERARRGARRCVVAIAVGSQVAMNPHCVADVRCC